MIGSTQYIGANPSCSFKCVENHYKAFKEHLNGVHRDFELHRFLQQNQCLLNKNKPNWKNSIDKTKEFFKQLSKLIEDIKIDTINKIEEERISYAISSETKEDTQIALSILNKEHQRLTCRDIHRFQSLKTRSIKMKIGVPEQKTNEAIKNVEKAIEDKLRGIIKKYQMIVPEDKELPEDNPLFQLKQTRQTRQKPNGNHLNGTKKQLNRTNGNDTKNHDNKTRHNNRNADNRAKVKKSQKESYAVTLIKDIKDKGFFDIEIKVKKILKEISSKVGPKVLFVGQDKTGQIQISVKKCDEVKEGQELRITKCSIFYHHGKREVSTRIQSEITVINNEKQIPKLIKTFEKKPKQNLDETAIIDIEPGERNYALNVKIIEIVDGTGDNLNCIIGDETGLSRALLPKKWQRVEEGAIVRLIKVNSDVIHERIVITTGKESLIGRSKKPISKINMNKNISNNLWVAEND